MIPQTKIARALLLGAALALAASAWQAQPKGGRSKAQAKMGPRPYAHPPDVANASYGPHPRNVLDLWKVKSERPAPVLVFIHGGGFLQGDKSLVFPQLLEGCLKAGIAVATINYRYSSIAIYPGPMADGARAVQFIRLHAKEWNINPRAVAASGGSAGAGISLWIGFHDDMAQPNSPDPVKRQSTRLSSMAVFNAQTSYDPRFIARLIDDSTGRHPALARLFGVPQGQDVMKAESKFQLYEDGSPVTHLTPGDPPAFLYYIRELKIPPPDQNEGIHSPRFGLYLKEQMDKLLVDCVVRTAKDYGAPEGAMPPQMFQDLIAFLQKHFPKE